MSLKPIRFFRTQLRHRKNPYGSLLVFVEDNAIVVSEPQETDTIFSVLHADKAHGFFTIEFRPDGTDRVFVDRYRRLSIAEPQHEGIPGIIIGIESAVQDDTVKIWPYYRELRVPSAQVRVTSARACLTAQKV